MRNKAETIQFHFLQSGFSLRDRARLKRFLAKLFTKEQKPLLSLDYIFCSDDYLLQINQQYLNHDFFTDIISFELSESALSVGEIYISIDRVRDNTRQMGTTFTNELHRVIFHGALHLCGYKDKTPAQKKEMRSKEEEYLAKYF